MRHRLSADVARRPGPIAGVLSLLAPARCLACRSRAEPPWCEGCGLDARPAPVGCPRCAAARGSGHACWPADAPIEATIAAFDYRGPIAAAVVTAKVGGAHAAWPVLGRLLATRVASDPPDVDAVTWITTPDRRVRERGVDHAQILADEVAGAIDRPLVRLLSAAPAGRAADRYRARLRLPGSNLLLVDDVVTTGATAWRAASALREADAGRLVLAILARAGSHPLGVVTRAARS